MNRRLRLVLAPLIVALTLVAFGYYISRHHDTVRMLGRVPLLTLVELVGLYIVFFLTMVLLTRVSLRVFHTRIAPQENMLLNAYSSLINFFGPGQSGPIFRGAYLKKRHNLPVKRYLFITLLSYAFYAMISALMMFGGTRPWWQTALLLVLVGGASIGVIIWYKQRSKIGPEISVHWPSMGWIAVATALQLGVQAIIYAVELHSLGAHASAGQVLAYTGVANFALFVALTPGAIGFRESFLLFSTRLHHIGSSTIVAANVLDRGAYLVLLALLAVAVVTLHAKRQLGVAQLENITNK
ncbi:MAG TPA: lysylphosphatidylglycerol synthase domain-containing protein [Patescibacteria group bacterium]|nr:lysylphosphatidylglycerol synthase domain-containing protein [Patescibacteria group bacterium]